MNFSDNEILVNKDWLSENGLLIGQVVGFKTSRTEYKLVKICGSFTIVPV
ncbi:hypothetical protein [Candidatus Harpocratesius sp.]